MGARRIGALVALGLALAAVGIGIRVHNAFHYPINKGFDARPNWRYIDRLGVFLFGVRRWDVCDDFDVSFGERFGNLPADRPYVVGWRGHEDGKGWLLVRSLFGGRPLCLGSYLFKQRQHLG